MRWGNVHRDTAHAPMVSELQQMGFSVADTSRCGDDFPDLVIGKHGLTALVEVKTKDRRKNGPVTARYIASDGQREFALNWRGSPVIFAYHADDVRAEFDWLLRRAGVLK